MRPTTRSVRNHAAAGALGGIMGGLAFGIVMVSLGVLPLVAGIIGAESSTVGFVIHLIISIVIGASFGALFRSSTQGYSANLMAGLAYGLIWWVLGGLTMFPLLLGESVRWSSEAAQAALPSLIGHLIYGGVAGLAFQLFASALELPSHPAGSEARDAVDRPHIVVLGGGFAGVAVAQNLERLLAPDEAEITLVSDKNYLLYTPMLAEVAGGSVEAPHIVTPLRAFFRRTAFRRVSIESIDVEDRTLVGVHCELCAPQPISYDYLVLALGAVPNYLGMDDVEAHALPIKALDDAVRLRGGLVELLEHADMEQDEARRRRLLTVVVGGGGFAGVEVVAELHNYVLSALPYYPNLTREDVRFVLVHSGDQLLPQVDPSLGQYTHDKLQSRGIEVRLETLISGAESDVVHLDDGSTIDTATLIWTAGVRAKPLVEQLPVEHGRGGTIVVDKHLAVPELPFVWAVGDCAQASDPDTGNPYPQTAQHALQAAEIAAENIVATVRGDPPQPFRYESLGWLISLGHRSAAADVMGVKFSGLAAWLAWRFVYLSKLPGWERKVRVTLDWVVDLFFPRDIVQTLPAMLQHPTVRSGEPLHESHDPDEQGQPVRVKAEATESEVV